MVNGQCSFSSSLKLSVSVTVTVNRTIFDTYLTENCPKKLTRFDANSACVHINDASQLAVM